jgi:hypothetical protein
MGEAAIVFATLLGRAGRAGAKVDRTCTREKSSGKSRFSGLSWRTPATFLSPAHVEALNAVPIEFYGNKKIVDPWKEYRNYLSTQGIPPEVWGQKRTDLLVDLLVEMVVFLGYDFNRVEISREVCWPTAHARTEADQQIIREGMAKLFRGEIAIPMDVKSFPVEAQALEEQQDLRRLLLKWLGGEQSVKVDLNLPSNR